MENGVYQVLDKEGNVIDYAEISDGNVYYFGAEEYESVNRFMEQNENNKLQLINKPVETTNEKPKIIVEVRGGVAYCDDPRVEIIDYDNLG